MYKCIHELQSLFNATVGKWTMRPQSANGHAALQADSAGKAPNLLHLQACLQAHTDTLSANLPISTAYRSGSLHPNPLIFHWGEDPKYLKYTDVYIASRLEIGYLPKIVASAIDYMITSFHRPYQTPCFFFATRSAAQGSYIQAAIVSAICPIMSIS